MNETDVHPTRHQRGLGAYHGPQQLEIRIGRCRHLGIVPFDHIVGQTPDGRQIAACGEELKRAHPDMTGGDPRQNRTRQWLFAVHSLSRGHRGQRPGRRNTQRVHGLADQVFPQHRTQHGAPIAAARIGGAAGPLQLYVAPRARPVPHLADENRPSVAQLRHEVAELMSGIGHGDGM